MKKLLIISIIVLATFNLKAQKINGLTFQFSKVEYYTTGEKDSLNNYTDKLISTKVSNSKIKFVVIQKYGFKRVLVYVTLDGKTEDYEVNMFNVYEPETDMYGREIKKDYSLAKLEDFYEEYANGYVFSIMSNYGQRFNSNFTISKDQKTVRLEIEYYTEDGKLRAIYLTK